MDKILKKIAEEYRLTEREVMYSRLVSLKRKLEDGKLYFRVEIKGRFSAEDNIFEALSVTETQISEKEPKSDTTIEYVESEDLWRIERFVTKTSDGTVIDCSWPKIGEDEEE